jgi:capsular exopolysaccharide synthesis family protein
MIILVALVAGGTALVATAQKPPVYEATVTMMVESGQPRLAALPTGTETGLEIAYLRDVASQIEVMKSRSVLERAITQLEPEKAADPQRLQLEVEQLRNVLTIQQFGSTNMVALTVVAYDPDTAQQKANAVAEAYINEIETATQTAIQNALENTNKQLEELRKRGIDLTDNPLLTRLTAQINIALPALEAASGNLQQMVQKEATTSPQSSNSTAEYAGTVLTASQLSTISRQIEDATSEANQLVALTKQINLLSVEKNFTARSANIAVIESRTRALATKLASLSTGVGAMREAEIDPQVQGELIAVEEQLRVANSTAGAILEQVVAMYTIQEQFRLASAATTSTPGQTARYEEADKNQLQRVLEHTNLLATSLGAASGQVQQIETRTPTITQWRFGTLVKQLSERVDLANSTLRTISQNLQPSIPEGSVLLSQSQITALEVQGQTVATTLTSLLSELGEAQSNELDPTISAELLNIQESVSVANGAIGGLGDEITKLSESAGDNLNYTALDSLRQQLQVAMLGMDSSGTRIVDKAVVSPSVDLFSKYKSVILAVVAGLLIGVLIALVLQYFDRMVRDASQVTSYIGLPLLAQVARVSASGNPHPPSVLTEQMFHCLEAFRLLRTNLGLDSNRGQVVLVSSPGEKEGKTTVAANLARVVALQGRRVLLIDGNLRKPDIAAAFGLIGEEGLSDFLKSERKPWDYITQVDGVDILPSGAVSVTSAEMLSSPRMKVLLEDAREIYDVVIVDGAPVMGCADTRVLAKEVDGVLLVLQMDASRLDLARDSRQALEAMGARLVGFVINKVDPKECKYLPPPNTNNRPRHDVGVETTADVGGVTR